MLTIDILTYIIDLKILTIKEICRLSRVNKELYDLIHNEIIIKKINKIMNYYDNQSKLSYKNLLYRVDNYKYPKPMNEIVVSSWYPLTFKDISIKNIDNLEWMNKYDNILKCYELCASNKNVDLSKFKNYYYIDLSYSYYIDDVSHLKNLHTVKLNRCKSITDVSMLGNVKHLDVSCSSVTDVSMLGNVDILILNSTNIKDISGLTNVKFLDISYTLVKNVSMLKKVKTLKMVATDINDISNLINVEYLDISWCGFIKTMPKLKKLQILRMDGLINLDTSILDNMNVIKC